MRWLLAALALLVLLSLALAWLRPAQRTPGMEMADALSRVPHDGPPLSTRTAIPLIDFVPDPATIPADPFNTGDGNLPGRPTLLLPDFHRAETRDSAVRFTWQSRPSARDPLRDALAPDSSAYQRVRTALATRGMLEHSIDRLLSEATTSLQALPDQQLLQEWLFADYESLLTDADTQTAVRDSLLLIAREERSPIITFALDKPIPAQIYLITLEPLITPKGWPATISLEMDAYSPAPAGRSPATMPAHAGSLLFTGTLFMDGPSNGAAPAPAQVRRWSVRMATLALEQLAPSTAPAVPHFQNIPQPLHQ
jgi:hypothetical protein